MGLTVLILMAGSLVIRAAFPAYASRGIVGIDLSMFQELGRRWTETGSMYAPFQLEGPYRFDQGSGGTDTSIMPALYPPYVAPVFALLRFMPFALWWAIPLGVIAWLVIGWRPAPWAWPLMAIATVTPNLTGVLAAGGSTMWITMFVALGCRYGWPAFLIVVKPTFMPLAIVGMRDGRMWLGIAGTVILLYLTGAEFGRYVTALENVQGTSLLYSAGDLWFVLIPVWAWLARR